MVLHPNPNPCTCHVLKFECDFKVKVLMKFLQDFIIINIFFFNFELELWSNCCWIVTSIWIGIQVLVLLIEPIQWVWPKSLSWSSLTELNFPGSSARERFFLFFLTYIYYMQLVSLLIHGDLFFWVQLYTIGSLYDLL